MEVPLSWERELWSCRSLRPPGERYVLTDFRLVKLAGAASDEIPLEDIGEVERTETKLDRLLNTSSVLIHSRAGARAPFRLKHIRRGPQLAALLDLIADETRTTWDSASVRAAMAWEPKVGKLYGKMLIALMAILVAVFAGAVGIHGKATAIVYPEDDAIAPGGAKRDRETITRFMEQDVLPWAKTALASIVGGPEFVTCATCHGRDAVARNYQMPAVAALPLPDVALRGWETWSHTMDAQTRNAVYGYMAESGNQAKAGYMREVVMPGMAKLLRRPAYDFTKSYDYNRSHVAFGCYHCHLVGAN
jgi:cytochrome c553